MNTLPLVAVIPITAPIAPAGRPIDGPAIDDHFADSLRQALAPHRRAPSETIGRRSEHRGNDETDRHLDSLGQAGPADNSATPVRPATHAAEATAQNDTGSGAEGPGVDLTTAGPVEPTLAVDDQPVSDSTGTESGAGVIAVADLASMVAALLATAAQVTATTPPESVDPATGDLQEVDSLTAAPAIRVETALVEGAASAPSTAVSSGSLPPQVQPSEATSTDAAASTESGSAPLAPAPTPTPAPPSGATSPTIATAAPDGLVTAPRLDDAPNLALVNRQTSTDAPGGQVPDGTEPTAPDLALGDGGGGGVSAAEPSGPAMASPAVADHTDTEVSDAPNEDAPDEQDTSGRATNTNESAATPPSAPRREVTPSAAEPVTALATGRPTAGEAGPVTTSAGLVEASAGAASPTVVAANPRSVDLSVTPARLAQVLAPEIRAMRGTTRQRLIEVRLDPPDLGSVDIEIRSAGSTITIIARTESPDAMAAVIRQRDQIAATLRSLGMDLGGFDVTSGEGRREPAENGRPGSTRQPSSRLGADLSDEPAATAASPNTQGSVFL